MTYNDARAASSKNPRKIILIQVRAFASSRHLACWRNHLQQAATIGGVMSFQLLRIEALNFERTVLDTDKLSVTRGGGLLLREAIVAVAAKVESLGGKGISTGASIGEFQIADANAQAALAAALAVLGASRYDCFTFAASLCADNERELAVAQTRFQQFQQLTLAPDLSTNASQACDWTKTRAAIEEVHATENHEKIWVGAGVKARHDFGRGEKLGQETLSGIEQFYQRETSPPEKVEKSDWVAAIRKLKFSNEFSEIATNAPVPWKRLENKLALIYLDGNKFSAFVKGKDADEVQRFDACLGKYRKALLGKLVQKAQADSECKNAAPMRLEVLMWGGDESELLVPAWCGFALTQWLFEAMQGWSFDGHELTHAMGLVFFHHKTPVARIRNLARELAQGCKDLMTPPNSTPPKLTNAYDYLVCESIDFPAQPLDEFWQARLRHEYAKAKRPLLPCNADLTELQKALRQLPRSQIYAAAACLAPGQRNETFDARIKRIEEDLGLKAQIDAVTSYFRPLLGAADTADKKKLDALLWVHLRELYDYLPVETSPLNSGVQP